MISTLSGLVFIISVVAFIIFLIWGFAKNQHINQKTWLWLLLAAVAIIVYVATYVERYDCAIFSFEGRNFCARYCRIGIIQQDTNPHKGTKCPTDCWWCHCPRPLHGLDWRYCFNRWWFTISSRIKEVPQLKKPFWAYI